MKTATCYDCGRPFNPDECETLGGGLLTGLCDQCWDNVCDRDWADMVKTVQVIDEQYALIEFAAEMSEYA